MGAGGKFNFLADRRHTAYHPGSSQDLLYAGEVYSRSCKQSSPPGWTS